MIDLLSKTIAYVKKEKWLSSEAFFTFLSYFIVKFKEVFKMEKVDNNYVC